MAGRDVRSIFILSIADHDYDHDGKLEWVSRSFIVNLNRDLQSIFSSFDFRSRL